MTGDAAAWRARLAPGSLPVNDVHSQLNPALVSGIVRPRSTEELAHIVRRAAKQAIAISICAGRHAMGGQQFGDDTLLIDTSELRAIRELDDRRGLVTVGAGITWPDLIRELFAMQGLRPPGESSRSKPAPTTSASAAPWLRTFMGAASRWRPSSRMWCPSRSSVPMAR
jgi:FAD/FMN-containing dehydrogenase